MLFIEYHVLFDDNFAQGLIVKMEEWQ